MYGTEQETQLASLIRDMASKIDTRLSAMEERYQRQIADCVRDISKLDSDFDSVRSRYRDRFREIADHYHRGGAYRGPYRDAEQAKQVGTFFAALASGKCSSLTDFNQAAAVSGKTGAGGGFLEIETIIEGIIRNVETYGVLESDAMLAEQPSQASKIIKRTSGLSVYHPDLGGTLTDSEPAFGAIMPELTTYAVYTPVARYMLQDQLAISLADFITQEMSLALAYATDLYGFMGDGSATHARVTGLFKQAGGADVTADTGDDTFQEVVDETVTYLMQLVGGLPHHADDGNLKLYMHRTMMFRYLGVKDTTGHPLLDWVRGLGPEGRPQFVLGGYPVRIVQVAPTMSQSAASTAMLVAGNLKRAVAIARHTAGTEFIVDQSIRVLQGEVAMIMNVRQDIKTTDSNQYGRLSTAAT